MAIFPTNKITTTEIPDAVANLSLGANNHTQKHNDMRDEIIAIEAKVGVNNSTDTNSIDYKLTNTASINPGHKHSVSSIDATGTPDSTTYLRGDGTWAGTSVPDASTSVKGITKLSTAPSSPTNPIAVGDNDTRLPTQNENDALVGTSGTAVSASNKLVDNADTGTGANKVLRLDSTGELPTGVTQTIELIAGNNLVAGNAVYSGYTNATPIILNNKLTTGGTWTGTSSSLSHSYTVNSGNDRILVVCIRATENYSGQTRTISNVSYGGVSMTSAQSQGNEGVLYYLVNPTVGTANITFTISAAQSYYGGDYNIMAYTFSNATYDTSAFSTTTSLSINVNTLATSIVLGFTGYTVNGSNTWTSTYLTNDSQNISNGYAKMFGGYTDDVAVLGSKTITVSGSTSAFFGMVLKPTNTPTFGANLTSSSNGINSPVSYTNFIGFATKNTNKGSVATIATGVINFLTGLTGATFYYLSDTKGAISTTAGTNSKKVGIATSATTLIMKDTI